MKKTGKISRIRTAWKNNYKNHRWVRGLHIFLQYIIIFVSAPLALMLLEYLWEERPGLLFVTIPGIIFTVSIVHTFLTDKKNRRTIEEEGRPSKEATNKFVHDIIVMTAIFAVYIVIKCLIKYVFN